MHSLSPGYRPGNHWIVCQRCGFDYHVSQVQKEWDGLIVCNGCYETKHPQLMVRALKDSQAPLGLVNPRETSYSFVSVSYITGDCRAGIARAGLSRAGHDDQYNNIPQGTFGDYSP